MTIANGAYVWQTKFYCKDCQGMKCVIGQLVCDDCNDVRKKLVYEDRNQDELEHQAEDERDQRDTIQSILSSMHPY
jgi:hypothetical protein